MPFRHYSLTHSLTIRPLLLLLLNLLAWPRPLQIFFVARDLYTKTLKQKCQASCCFISTVSANSEHSAQQAYRILCRDVIFFSFSLLPAYSTYCSLFWYYWLSFSISDFVLFFFWNWSGLDSYYSRVQIRKWTVWTLSFRSGSATPCL